MQHYKSAAKKHEQKKGNTRLKPRQGQRTQKLSDQ